jgi:hypothetical protein
MHISDYKLQLRMAQMVCNQLHAGFSSFAPYKGIISDYIGFEVFMVVIDCDVGSDTKQP